METRCNITLQSGHTEIVSVYYTIINNEDIETIRELDLIDQVNWLIITITSDNVDIQEEIEADYNEFKLEVIPQL